MKIIGVISDTHGLLRPEAAEALKGTSLILHAGDIGKPEILDRLGEIAPVIAIRGNNDEGPWARTLPHTRALTAEGIPIYMLHDLKEIDIDPAAEGYRVVISGHSHKSLVKEHNGVLYLNPGSAGPRRFRLPVSVARVKVSKQGIKAEIVELGV